MAYVPYFTMPQLTDQYPTVQDFLPIASDNYYWILVDCTQMDLNHHQFVLPLNYVCIQWVEILPQPNRRKNYACFFGIPKSTRCMPAEWQSLKKTIRWYDGVPLRIVAMEESVRFELTEHYCSSVFKTDALNQTLPTFHVALGARLELATLWLTARCSTIELPKNKCNHLMCGRFEQPSSHCVRYSTVELTHDYCVAHIVKHSMATFYPLR